MPNIEKISFLYTKIGFKLAPLKIKNHEKNTFTQCNYGFICRSSTGLFC